MASVELFFYKKIAVAVVCIEKEVNIAPLQKTKNAKHFKILVA